MERRCIVQGLVLLLIWFNNGAMLVKTEEGAPMENKEKEALYSVIQNFVGGSWNGSGLYPDPCGWSPIQGVSCDLFKGLWYITSLSIGPVLDNSLQCAPGANFTPMLFELTHLKSLSFFDCFSLNQQLAITIPSTGWDKFATTLETLEFRSNPGLTGPIPTSLGMVKSLKSLVIVGNGLTGEVPFEIGHLVNLRRLVISGNRLTGSIPTSIGGLTSLLKLDLSHNLLQGNLPTEIGNLKDLNLMDLRNNTFTGGLVPSLQNMVSLQDLLMSNNLLLGGTLMSIGWSNMVNLTTLDLSNTGITGSIPNSLLGLKSMRCLALDNNHLSGNVPQNLANMPNLSALYINGNNFTGELGFSHDFYERLGRRFASWNNPSLCYNAREIREGHKGPFGVQKCTGDKGASFGQGDKVDRPGPDVNSSLLVSFGLPGYRVSGFWWLVLVRELVATFFLVMVL
ncbi:piriformospora indica-insensitive protein 2-like protein [Carex littledalei]|uniref:Piriformospora indica-insensitive protein 2-like protein n=1 Tax=Carex littledalei TaxID=544730 RepID=A0A833R3M3_9POAL|nr:piriformospora indica-insensitive protein 2-like protein [Carex littledalei]